MDDYSDQTYMEDTLREILAILGGMEIRLDIAQLELDGEMK